MFLVIVNAVFCGPLLFILAFSALLHGCGDVFGCFLCVDLHLQRISAQLLACCVAFAGVLCLIFMCCYVVFRMF